MVNSILVLGGGSAGFLAAITLKRRLPAIDVLVVRSPEIGIIGVGEGTTVAVTHHLHGYLGLDPNPFHREVDPIWKLGLRFRWGRRPRFDYAFAQGMDSRLPGLSKPTGHYAGEDMDDYCLAAALMRRDRVFARYKDGSPAVDGTFAYHLENATFVAWLERTAARFGVRVADGTVAAVSQGEAGVTGLTLADGRSLSADLYVDCSGFKSVLLRGALGEPFVNYKSSLWCDRAVVGGWDRPPGDVVRPYTSVDTMAAGWAWRIDHEHRVNRGYVYSSAYLSDDRAEAEFRAANPLLGPTRIVPFKSGRADRAWVKNVVGIGNAFGFVEPLEATSLGVICTSSRNLAELLADGDRVVRPSQAAVYNVTHTRAFDAIRWFLALHYRFNDLLDTPFWTDCRAGVDDAGVRPVVDYYRENGPSALFRSALLDPHDPFGVEGYLVMLVGMRVPYRRTYVPPAAERAAWDKARALNAAAAESGFAVAEALSRIRTPTYGWSPATFAGGGVNPAAVATAAR